MKRAIIILSILIVAIGLWVAIQFLITPKTYSVSEDPSVETLVVKTDTIVATVDAAARLEALETADLTFEVTGEVAKIYVSEGVRVEAGALLAELETTDLVQAVALAEIELTRTKAQLEKLLEPPAQADIDAAQASLDSARANLADLLDGASDPDIKAAQVALDSARANLQRVLDGPSTDSITVAAANMRRAEIALKQAQESYDEVAYDSRLANLRAPALEQATIDYETALANFNLAVKEAEDAEILAAQAQVASAEASLQKLLDGADMAQILAAQAQIAQAEATLQKLIEGPSETDLIIAQAAVETAEINLEQAQRNLERTRLYSPLTGTVTRINIKENEPANKPIAISLADLAAFKLEVEIDEIDINRLASRQPVIITLDSLPDEEYTGFVESVGVAPIESATSGIVAYPVTVVVESQDAPFKIGMNVNATIETERLEDVVVVENRAIQIDRETGKAYVEKVEDDQTIVQVEVTLGQRSNTVSQILSGLEEGDTIAIREKSRREELRRVLSGESGD
jgi:HlyD family secretion protein